MRTWEADVETCQGCFGLDTTAARLQESRGTGHGQRPRLFYIKDKDHLNG